MRKVVLLIILGLTSMVVVCSETNETSYVLQIEQLTNENDALRRENQRLRRELVSKNGALPDSLLPKKVVEHESAVDAGVEDTGFWISSKSKVRHNRRCRNYRKVKGRPCGPSDGRPCKKCGG